MIRPVLLCLLGLAPGVLSQEAQPKKKPAAAWNAATFAGLKFRGIGPALMSGRVVDIAVDPTNRSHWYVAVASGGVWETWNRGTTWKPIFDRQGSYSIGCVAVDPHRPLIVWVGTGENNSQRSVGFGDGLYKSTDGGKTWKRVGLEHSEHIARILIHPDNPDIVYVAAQGPLWAPGGDRGLFKTTDGGKTWTCVLPISENTGVTDVVFDPRDPEVLYAAAYQRRRHVWTLIDGGPESAIYKSTDGGKTWRKLTRGLPRGDLGRIGLAVSPQRPDVVYAIIEAEGEGSGFYRSEDGGQSWRKMSSYISSSPQYYQEIFCDPFRFDRVYSMDTRLMVTEDGGKTFRPLPGRARHVDHHALVFDPKDPNYLLVGTDGGVYESYDRGKTWVFKANLPVTQFYKCCVDDALPFYHVYGGTQDNNTQGGPSRTRSRHGITNADWFVTVGGDGFKPQVEPGNPNIVYSQYQYGGLRRYDRKSGSILNIVPEPALGEDPLRFNWDSALMISPHSPTRIYFAAQKLFRSDDRGASWRAVSPDLTRRLDRNSLEVMGKVWSVDAVAKNRSTSYYGTIVALTESPLVEGLIYTGADDGMLAVTEDGGAHWRKIPSVPGIPRLAYVADLEADRHDPDTVYAVFNNHKMGDFKPYVMKSTDRGRSWTSITGDLPQRGPVWCVAQDHVDPRLLFVGTEFGVFFTRDGGKRWVQLKGGIPTIAVRDLEIQRRENDLVCATFGRGFYILDDYTPLRVVTKEILAREAYLFPAKTARLYTLRGRLGSRKKGTQGDGFFTAPNPPYGAVFTYYLRESLKTRRARRRERERRLFKETGRVKYPPWEELRAEDREEKPVIEFLVTHADGQPLRRITGPATKGFHRVAWDLRYPGVGPRGTGRGPRVVPGTYRVQMFKRVDGRRTPLGEPRVFRVEALHTGTLPPPDRQVLLAFQRKVGELQRAVMGAVELVRETKKRLETLRAVADGWPQAGPKLGTEIRTLYRRLLDLEEKLTGDRTIRRRMEPTPPSIVERTRRAASGDWNVPPTPTQKKAYQLAAQLFAPVLKDLRKLVTEDLPAVERALEAAGAPWTPGRVPRWPR